MTTRTPEMARALAEDRWDQMTVVPVPDTSDSGATIDVSPRWLLLEEILHECAARAVGGEVVAFGMRQLVEGLEDTIRERTIDWATRYMLGEFDADLAAERETAS